MTEPQATVVTTGAVVVPELEWTITSHRPLAPWIVPFLVHLETAEGKSKSTVRHYAHDLDLFSRYLSAYAPWVVTPEDVTSQIITGFLRYMRVVRGNSATSTKRRLSSLRRFFGYLVQCGEISHDPTAPLPMVQSRSRPAPALTREEALRFLEASKTTSFPTRDHAIFRLFLTCGCTLSELLDLKVGDFDPDESTITFRGRSRRTLSLPPACRQALLDYLSDRPKAPASSQLFLNRLGRGIKRGAVYYAFDLILRRSGINKPGLTIHSLRRTCLTLLWEAGISLHALQQIAGLSSLGSTREYIQVEARPSSHPPWKWQHPLEE